MTLNPIFAFSARRRMRSWRTPTIITVSSLVMLVAACLTGLAPVFGDSMTVVDSRNGLDGYIYLTGIEFLMIVMIAPAMTAGSIAGERERQTLEMLLVTNTSSVRIAIGKLLESLSFLAFMLIALLPFNCSMLVYGGVSISDVTRSTLFLLATALAASSVGLLTSSIFKRTVTATVVAYIVIFAIGVGTLFPLTGLNYERLEPLFSDPAALTSVTRRDIMLLIPAPVYFNPAFGLALLLADQSGVLKDTIQTIIPGSYYSYYLYERAGMVYIADATAACISLAGVALSLVSAAFIRPRVGRMRGK